MALIRHIAPAGFGKRGRVHGEVDCGYTIFAVAGRDYLQLDTYGSPNRSIPGKTSQSIQLDRASARQLKALIQRTFPGV